MICFSSAESGPFVLVRAGKREYRVYGLPGAAPALRAEATELLRHAEYQDGLATVRTQDCEALETALALAGGAAPAAPVEAVSDVGISNAKHSGDFDGDPAETRISGSVKVAGRMFHYEAFQVKGEEYPEWTQAVNESLQSELDAVLVITGESNPRLMEQDGRFYVEVLTPYAR